MTENVHCICEGALRNREGVAVSAPVGLVQRHVHPLHDVCNGDCGGTGDSSQAVHQDPGIRSLGFLCKDIGTSAHLPFKDVFIRAIQDNLISNPTTWLMKVTLPQQICG